MTNGGGEMNYSDKREITKVQKSIQGTLNSISKHKNALVRIGISNGDIKRMVISLITLRLYLNLTKKIDD